MKIGPLAAIVYSKLTLWDVGSATCPGESAET